MNETAFSKIPLHKTFRASKAQGPFIRLGPNEYVDNSGVVYGAGSSNAAVWKIPQIPRRKLFSGYIGFDPIIGAPYPTINYQMNEPQTSGNTRVLLSWTVPDVIIAASGDLVHNVRITLTNYSFPPWDEFHTYIKEEGAISNGTRYRSKTNDNLGNFPDTDPVNWTADTTEYVLYMYSAGQLSVEGVTTLPAAAGFWQVEMNGNFVSFVQTNYAAAPGRAWFVDAVNGNVQLEGDPPRVTGTRIVHSNEITF